jgi:polysaccharide biosynthesis/export protein
VIPGLHVAQPDSDDSAYRLVDLTPQSLQSLRHNGTGAQPTLPPLQPGSAMPEYRIGPGDVLTVVVWDHPELTNPTGEFRDPVSAGRLVSADGTIIYPYAGVMPVAGKTVAEVAGELAGALARVIQNPQVDVRVAAFRSQRIQVTGEVRQPGLVTLDDTPKGVLEAINERGGLAENASRREALLVRGGHTHAIDISGLLSGAQPGGNPELRAGDVIHVPSRAGDQVFVLGEVERQAPLVIGSGRMSLTEALAGAGGLARLSANDAGVLVFRRGEGAQQVPTVFRVDLSQPQGLLLAGEFELQPRDVVYVKATTFSQYNLVINQLLPTISAIFQLDRLVND